MIKFFFCSSTGLNVFPILTLNRRLYANAIHTLIPDHTYCPINPVCKIETKTKTTRANDNSKKSLSWKTNERDRIWSGVKNFTGRNKSEWKHRCSALYSKSEKSSTIFFEIKYLVGKQIMND